jgi:hypothetical protein
MADRFADFYPIRLSARAELAGARLSVTMFQVDYRLDRIPTAVIHCPIGRDARLPGRFSEAQGLLSSILPFTPIKLFVTAEALEGRAAPPTKDPGFGKGEMLIFEGFVGGPSFSKSASGTASLKLDCFGVAGALSGTTRFSTGITAVRNLNGSETAIVRFGGGSAGGNERVKRSFADVLDKNPSETALWDEGILILFESVINLTDAWFNQDNDFAQQAALRINVDGAEDTPDLSLKHFVGQQKTLRRRLSRSLTEEFYNTWAQNGDGSDSDLWNVLVRYTSMFLFHFVPRAESDLLAPVTFGLGGDPFCTLDPSEYNIVGGGKELGPEFYSYITSVGLYLTDAVSGPWQDGSARATFAGRAILDDLPRGRGRLMTLPAPLWLRPAPLDGTVSLLPGEGIPDIASLAAIGSAPIFRPSAVESEPSITGEGNAWAQTALHEAIFMHRVLALSGRLRMDIAPGSLIRINTPGERFTGLGDVLFGHVMGLTLEMGTRGQESLARTIFDVGHVRSEDEHKRFTVERHPVFLEEWRGSKLVAY